MLLFLSDGNNFDGHIPEGIGELKELRFLNLSACIVMPNIDLNCEITNKIYVSLISFLRYMNISGNNRLTGSIPESIKNLDNLEILLLSM